MVVGVTTSQPFPVGAVVRESVGSSWVELTRNDLDASNPDPIEVTVKVAGIRQERRGVRFPIFTPEQAQNNRAFWSRAYEG